ncbi:helix-turn-helix transcriptional regulator [Kribbella speibonae]|uniref:helix-turn-helix transcriptional regulator n=1 Tax=Kribbella speibonae TaxID=1572660 RepID=UPI0013F3B7BF|nr:helix-turn-helix transcriptional regulator [Kribbella speibonae]
MGDLTALGLSPDEEAAYSALVASGPSDNEQNAVLTSLIAKGLVSRVSERYVAVAPDIALEVLLLEQERLLRDARAHIDDLSAAYRNHTGTPTATLVELVTGGGAVRQRIDQVQAAARTELRRLVKAPYGDPPVQRAECRTVYEHGVLDAHGNETARVLPALPIHLYLADDRLALVLLSEESAVLVQPCGLFDAYVELFEALWERALPVKADGTLVKLLLAGLTDQAIARQLGVSERTAQRKIAALMQELGARTRFQAGAQAAIKGQ